MTATHVTAPRVDRSASARGVRTGVPLLLGFLPCALALGPSFAATGLDPWVTWSSSWLVFAGASQAVAVTGLDAGDAPVVIVLSCLVINGRHLLYGASLRPLVESWRPRHRLFAAYFLTDPMFAIASARFARRPADSDRSHRNFFFGAALVGWLAWLLGTGAGVVLGALAPSALPIHLAAPLTFVLLLFPQLTTGQACASAAVAATVAIAAAALPMGTGVLVGIAAGILVGGRAGGRRR
jgi:4-azaleucine resistance transporter AzlC